MFLQNLYRSLFHCIWCVLCGKRSRQLTERNFKWASFHVFYQSIVAPIWIRQFRLMHFWNKNWPFQKTKGSNQMKNNLWPVLSSNIRILIVSNMLADFKTIWLYYKYKRNVSWGMICTYDHHFPLDHFLIPKRQLSLRKIQAQSDWIEWFYQNSSILICWK